MTHQPVNERRRLSPAMQVLSDLQDRLQPFPTDQAMAVIEEELQASIGDVFSQLSAQPVAAASLGQVCLPVSCLLPLRVLPCRHATQELEVTHY